MSFTIHCPNGHSVSVREDFAGKVGLCPRCRARMRVPALTQAAENPRASGEFVHPNVSADWNRAEPAASSPSFPTLVKKKTRQCVGCGNVVSQSFTACPRCGTSLAPYRHLGVQKDADAVVVSFTDHQMRDERIVTEIAGELCNLADRVQQQHLVLDFSGVVGISSVMLGKLVMLQAKMKKLGGDLRLRNVGSEVSHVLTTMHLDRMLKVEGEGREVES